MKKRVKFIFWILAIQSSALACGPFFPVRMLLSDDSFLLRAVSIRRAYFELDLLSREGGDYQARLPEREAWDTGAFSESAMRDLTYDAAREDFVRAVESDESLDTELRARLVRGFSVARDALRAEGNAGDLVEVVSGFLDELSKAVPESGQEFELYLRGAMEFRLGRLIEASQSWEELLELPAERRRFRSVWAAYMLGRANADAAGKWFSMARLLAKEGFEDSTGLAAASFGWEAKEALSAGRYEEACKLYLRHFESGYDSAAQSLDTLARTVLADVDYDLREAARHDALSDLVTNFLVRSWNRLYESGEAAPGVERWLEVVGADGNVKYAGRLALLAYRHGDDEGAARWIAKAAVDDEFAIWIQAKLLLKAGNIDGGVERLDRAKQALGRKGVEALAGPGLKEIGGLAGVALATRSDFDGALAAFLSGGHWLDAAYVAETAMGVDQLVDFINRGGASLVESDDVEFAANWKSLRLLCARRLVREGRYGEAAEFFEGDVRGRIESLRQYLELANNERVEAAERARAFWEAALIERSHGMELLATELFPDYACMQGGYQLEDERLARSGLGANVINRPGEVERERIRVARDRLSTRFHYRNLAAALAWKAAELLPDEDLRTATILASAGNWLKYRDPEAADPFFKALVIRCGRTELGERAMLRNWIPDVFEEVVW